MPHWDFKCDVCHHVEDYAFASHAAMMQWNGSAVCPKGCGGLMERQLSSSTFSVTGFNQMTGYASEQVRVQRKNGIRIETKGNFEAFDKLTNS